MEKYHGNMFWTKFFILFENENRKLSKKIGTEILKFIVIKCRLKNYH